MINNNNLKTRNTSLKRNSNIELCRVICMIILIAHHCVVHGGFIDITENCINKVIALFLIPGGKLAFDCFLAISCWFLIDQNFKSQRFFKLWLQVLFYSITFFIISCMLNPQFSIRSLLSVFFPMTGNSHGFAASYLAFYLLLPFIKKMTDGLTRKKARYLLILLFYFEVISQVIGNFNQYIQPLSSELLLFVLFYVIAFNLKKWPLKIFQNKWAMIGVFYFIWYIVFIIRYSHSLNPDNPILLFLINITTDESSCINIIGGFALFFTFLNMKESKNTIINFLATGTFGILLFHDHNFFRYILWKDIFKTESWYYSKYFILFLIIITLLVYIIGFVIDKIRIVLIERPIFNNLSIVKKCKHLDSLIYERNYQHEK